MPKCGVVLAHEHRSWVHTSASNALEENAIREDDSARYFCATVCLLSLLYLIVKIYMGDRSRVTCLM